MASVMIPMRTYSTLNQREHWARRHRRAKRERQDACLLTPMAEPPCIVTLTRIAPRSLDDDNLRGALKAVRDGVADKLGVDDADPRVTWQYGQRKGRPHEYAVVIEINRVEK